MAKLHIPPEAITTLRNSEFFSFKRAFIVELIQFFGDIIEQLKADPTLQAFPFPAGTDKDVGKISKGENYRGLPYVIADFPRLFTTETVFAYRILFWWGHYFTCTWHISGKALDHFWPCLQQNWSLLVDQEVHIALVGDEWQHAIEYPMYQPLQHVTMPVDKPAFVKVTIRIPFEAYDKLEQKAIAFAHTMLLVLKKS